MDPSFSYLGEVSNRGKGLNNTLTKKKLNEILTDTLAETLNWHPKETLNETLNETLKKP